MPTCRPVWEAAIPGGHADTYGGLFVQVPSPALAGVDEVLRALRGNGNAATSGYIL